MFKIKIRLNLRSENETWGLEISLEVTGYLVVEADGEN